MGENGIKEGKLTRFNTFSIVAVSILWMYEVAAIAPALGPLMQAFPDATPLEIKTVMTAPFITTFIFSIFSGGFLARHFDKKKILIVGLILYGITGLTPAFATQMSVILVLRFLTGVGVGLIVPHSNTIISQHFSGKTRERLLGANISVANLGNVVVNIAVSALLVFGWKYAFYSFIFIFVILILVVVGVPKSMPYKEDKPAEASRDGVQKPKLPPAIFAIALLNAFAFCVFGFVPTNMSMYLTQYNLVPVWAIGIVMAFGAIAAIIGGILIPEFMKLFKRYLIFFSMLLAAIGFFLLSVSPTLPAIILGGVLCGLGVQGLIPPMIFEMTARRTQLSQRDLAFGIVNSSMYIGSFVGPFLQSLVTTIGHNESTEFIFLGGGVIMLVSTVVALIAAIATRKSAGGQAA